MDPVITLMKFLTTGERCKGDKSSIKPIKRGRNVWSGEKPFRINTKMCRQGESKTGGDGTFDWHSITRTKSD